jgi:DNA-binding winged helix-turn-helix (wHTH) protein
MIVIDKNKRTVTVDGKEIHISKTKLDILFCLKLEEYVASSTIADAIVKADGYMKIRTIDTHITHLRRLFGLKDTILNRRGDGYRLNKEFFTIISLEEVYSEKQLREWLCRCAKRFSNETIHDTWVIGWFNDQKNKSCPEQK